MNLREMTEKYHEEGLTMELAAARVCQDVVLKAIADGPLNRNVTIKGGVVMRSITKNSRRATRDIDLDFITENLIYSDDGMRENSSNDIIRRISNTFKNEQYMRRVSTSRQRWIDDDIHDIADGIVTYLRQLN